MRRLLPILAVLALGPSVSAQPVTGEAVPEMAHVDTFVQGLMAQHGIHGAAVAVVKDERLVYARGFGYADVDAQEPVAPDALFRIGSISKPVTAVVTMSLVEDGLLSLDEPAFAWLPGLAPPAGQTADPRVADITVRDLLQHSGGWDREIGGEPLNKTVEIMAALGLDAPPTCDDVIRFQLGQPLDFDPGTRYAYNGFDYCVLGAIVERVTGLGYETAAQTVLAEAGIQRMRIGAELLEGRAPGEVRYYDPATAPSIFDPTQTVPMVYGGFDLTARAASGGWIASAVDLVRFLAAVDARPNRPDVLGPEALATMLERPDLAVWNGTASWYALGWQRNTADTWFHSGALPGSRATIVRPETDGLSWAVVVNTTPATPETFFPDVNQGLFAQSAAVASWPTHDLFASFETADETRPEPASPAMTVAPNPASRRAAVSVSLPEAGAVRVAVLDVLGREVAVLHDGPLAAGDRALRLDAAPLPAGVYVVRAVTPTRTASRTLTVVR